MDSFLTFLSSGIYTITSINQSISSDQKDILKIGLGDLSGDTFDIVFLFGSNANKYAKYLIKGQLVSVNINKKGFITNITRPRYWELKELMYNYIK